MTDREKFEAMQMQIDALKAMHELLTVSIAGLLPDLGQRPTQVFLNLHHKTAKHWGNSNKPSEVMAALMFAPLLAKLQPVTELLHNAQLTLDTATVAIAQAQQSAQKAASTTPPPKPPRAPRAKRPPPKA